MAMYNSRSFKKNQETGLSEIAFGGFKIIVIGHRPEDIYQFKIEIDKTEAEFAATGTIDTDATGNGVCFSWRVDFAKSIQLEEATASEKEKSAIRLQVSQRIESFLKSYCPDITSYPLKNYSESERFRKWSGKDQ